MIRSASVALLTLLLCALSAFGQTTTLTGTVSDPSGAVIPNAKLVLENPATGLSRDAVSDNEGRYTFAQIAPGTYKLTAKAQGFNDTVLQDIRLLVNQPITINVTFEKLSGNVQVVEVAGATSQINTVDASLGNAIGDKPILQLPFDARNVVGLLAIQPGVTFIREPDPGSNGDYRSGAVNGGKSDQANVTLDGVDVNDQQERNAFTSVLRVTLDSTQEFRTTTLNAGADQGRSSGAQVSIVTKSGTNIVHGSAYEFHRNTLTSANSFFNNLSGVPRERLIRNVYGVSMGGPIKKNRLFLFGNYEGRKDRSDGQNLQVVPNATFRQGLFNFIRTDGSRGQLSQAEIRNLDPAGIGVNPEVVRLLQSYPLPNDNTVGDGVNTAGFRFNGPRPLDWNTYVAKLDYVLDSAAKHQVFVRGQLQNDKFASGLPQFPGEPASQVFLEGNRGIAVGYTGLLRPTLVSNFRYGFTRQAQEFTGLQTAPAATFRDLTDRFALTRSLVRILPTTTVSQDFNWTKGAHSVTFGGVIRLVRNNRLNQGNSFSNLFANSSWLLGTGNQFVAPGARNSTPYRRQFTNLLGLMTQKTRQANYDLNGGLFAEGALIPRKFAQEEYEMYVQDTWKITRALTFTAGLRYSLLPPVYESAGYQTSPNIPLGDWFNQRGALAQQGLSQAGAPRIGFDLASRTNVGLYDYFKNWQPRVALAYSPQGNSGLSKFLFGGPGKTSIRAGFGLYYDILGQGLIRSADATALGFSTSLQNPATANANPNAANNPAYRFTGFYSVPLSVLPAAPRGGFPQVQPDIFQITNSVDSKLKAPYTMNMNFSIGRELGNGWFVQGSYAGRLSRRSLIRDDVAMPTNLKDPASGQTYFEAASALVRLAQSNTPIASVSPIAFWENMWPGARGGGRTATQNIYELYRDFARSDGDYTTALTLIDTECDPACSRLGPYAIFNSQYSSLSAFRSRGQGNYHAMQWVIRKRFTQGYQFDFNYTWSKSTDFGSFIERSGRFSGQIRNAWFPGDMKAVSDYDQTHIFSMLGLAELPFGKGKKYLSNVPKFGQVLIGGWQVSGIWRQTSGFVNGVLMDSGWPTNWNVFSFADQVGNPGATGAFKNAPRASGSGTGPNIFANPRQAIDAYTRNGLPSTLPGGSGQRNGIRGDGLFNVDFGLMKRFELFTFRDQKHTLQIRAEAFNVTNSVRFDIQSSTITNLGTATQGVFGNYTDQLVRPRVFQFGARYEF
jgi:hypothetical protein